MDDICRTYYAHKKNNKYINVLKSQEDKLFIRQIKIGREEACCDGVE
jgi:hypothetical protein